MIDDPALARVRSLGLDVATKLNLGKVLDTYFFLVRVGTNFSEYAFNWEPFRDLAGPLRAGSNSIPIVVVSDSTMRLEPEIKRSEEPMAHYEMVVSPTVSVTAVVRMWLDLLVENGASHGSNKGSFGWFLKYLDVKADVLSDKGRRFLGL
jgi:hypothetical protein